MFDQEYLINLINNKIEESLNLDYKAAGALQRTDTKTKEISKDVSAFANSAGGIIIYGLKEDSINKHIVSEIDPVDRKVISKEWLEQIIQSQIQPRVDGIIIHPIEIDGDINKVVYVVEISKSTTAHQAVDKRYYKRFNFNSEPMYDYEIKDILNRPKHPSIDLEFRVVRSKSGKGANDLEVIAHNNGQVLAQYINCYVTIPSKCLKESYDAFSKTTVDFYFENTIRDVVDIQGTYPSFTYKYGPARYEPILPKRSMLLRSRIDNLHEFYFDYENVVEWIVYADNSEPVSGSIRFQDVPIVNN